MIDPLQWQPTEQGGEGFYADTAKGRYHVIREDGQGWPRYFGHFETWGGVGEKWSSEIPDGPAPAWLAKVECEKHAEEHNVPRL